MKYKLEDLLDPKKNSRIAVNEFCVSQATYAADYGAGFFKACELIKAALAAAPTPPLNTQDGVDERAEFEKWFERIHNDTWTFYKENLFQAWQARSNLSNNTEKKKG